MSKRLFLFSFLLWALRLAAQLPDGSNAPNFTVTDLNGQSWNLYNLLAQHKIVVMEVNATWCGPCWSYHNSDALNQLYAEHGTAGEDKLRVLFVEGDPATNINCLYGPDGCNSFSPGNWVAGTNYPIADNAYVASAYEVTYFPTIYIIFPNRKLYEVSTLGADELWALANECPVASGNDNAGLFDFSPGTPFYEICDTDVLQPGLSLINLGINVLTDARIDLKWNGATVQSYDWSGDLALYEDTPIVFDPLPVSGAGTLSVQLTEVNSAQADDDPVNNYRSRQFASAKAVNALKAILKIRTDQFGAETYWELRDEYGVVLDHGGNTDVGPNGGGQFPGGITGGPGAYGDNVIITDTLVLPEEGCYSLHVIDAFGDGMCCDYGNGYYKLYNLNNQSITVLSGGDFNIADSRVFGTPGVVSASEPASALTSLSLSPNPATSTLQVRVDLTEKSAVLLTVMDAAGRVIRTEKAGVMPPGAGQIDLSVSELSSGFYWLRLDAGGQTLTRTFIVQ